MGKKFKQKILEQVKETSETISTLDPWARRPDESEAMYNYFREFAQRKINDSSYTIVEYTKEVMKNPKSTYLNQISCQKKWATRINAIKIKNAETTGDMDTVQRDLFDDTMYIMKQTVAKIREKLEAADWDYSKITKEESDILKKGMEFIKETYKKAESAKRKSEQNVQVNSGEEVGSMNYDKLKAKLIK